MEQSKLTNEEVSLWRAFWRMGERTALCVERALLEAGELSGADYGILSRLIESNADGELRQIELQASMGWDKSRLSHHLSRMAQRNLIARSHVGHNVTLVRVTPPGREKHGVTTPAYHKAIYDFFLSQLAAEELAALTSVARKLKAAAEKSESLESENTAL